MTGPQRKGSAPAEATQSLSALDVVEIESLEPEPIEGTPAPRKTLASNSSIAPVGLDLVPSRARAEDEANTTAHIRLPSRRKRLGGIVIGAVAGCVLILLGAGIARIGHASGESQAEAHTAVPATATAPGVTTAQAPASPPVTTSASTAPPTTATGGSSGSTESTGTVRINRPAVPGHVWLDGKKLTSSSALVSCGTHQIKVASKRAHSIDVPCGGEIGVSK
jgi:hypothetical protein